jgi:hypothetical protein
MDPINNPVSANEVSPLRLAPGVSLERQCNENYAYLNSQGISMGQYVGALRELYATASQRTQADEYDFVVSRTISGYTNNPLTGAEDRGNQVTINSRRPDDLLFMIGETEIAVAEAGIFGSPATYSLPAGAPRAEQIIEVLRATELGQPILASQGIDDPASNPKQPIALLEEPVGPTPGEVQRAQAEASAEQIAAEMTVTAKTLKNAVPKDVAQTHKVDFPKKGKRTKIAIHEDIEPDEYGFASAMWLEVSEWRDGTTDYKIIRAQKYRTEQQYNLNSQQDITWKEGGAPGRYIEKAIPMSDPRNYRDHKRSETVLVPLAAKELTGLNEQFTQAAQKKMAEWQASRSGRIGSGVLKLFGRH